MNVFYLFLCLLFGQIRTWEYGNASVWISMPHYQSSSVLNSNSINHNDLAVNWIPLNQHNRLNDQNWNILKITLNTISTKQNKKLNVSSIEELHVQQFSKKYEFEFLVNIIYLASLKECSNVCRLKILQIWIHFFARDIVCVFILLISFCTFCHIRTSISSML